MKIFRYLIVILLVIPLLCFFLPPPVQDAGAAGGLSPAAAGRFNQAVLLYVGSPNSLVYNNMMVLDAPPVIKNSRTLVPVRFISESLGAQVSYAAETQTVTVTLEGTTVRLVLGSHQIWVNNWQSSLDVPAESIQGRTCIPLRALVEALGKQVFYHQGLIVISDVEDILDEKADLNLIQEAIGLLSGQGSAPPSPTVTQPPVLQPPVQPPPPPSLQLEPYAGDFFTMNRPRGWEVFGNYQGKAHMMLARDPREPLRQVFYLSEIGPLYYSQNQKQIDYQYYTLTGLPWWFNHPVVAPFTPESFLKQFHVVKESGSMMGQLIPPVTSLKNVEIISSQQMPVAGGGSSCALLRAVFLENGRVGQGIFMVTMVPLFPGWGAAYMFTGITAPVNEFAALEKDLVTAVRSFQLTDAYVALCQREQQATTQAIIARGQILSETSDIITQNWKNRSRSDDVIAAKWSDTMLGKERLYEPATGLVYEFNSGFYNQYNLDRNQYQMNNLQPLPESNHDLWIQVTLDGHANLR